VYDGQHYLESAIESVLARTYPDFALVVSDNASSDRTEEICRRYAEADARVRHHRRATNHGAAANFNRVFELAAGSLYFKWAACVWIAPNFLERCVRELEENPDAVLCQSLVKIVGMTARSSRRTRRTAPAGTAHPRALAPASGVTAPWTPSA
jgi:glycosyltransferase involved in cell wall biosynthesis